MTTTNYPIPTTAQDYISRLEKNALREARRPQPLSTAEILGPGVSARAVQIMDWNSEEATFNGNFWSAPGALNSPDAAVRWIGTVSAQDDFNGVQTVYEAQPPADEVVEPPPDDPAPIPTEGDPEPEPPTTGNVTPIRTFVRYFSIKPEGTAKYTEWQPLGASTGGALADLRDVKIFEPLAHHDVLLWDSDYGTEGAWVNHPFIPGIAGLQHDVEDIISDIEDLIDFQGSLFQVFRQGEPPVPGVSGVPDPIPLHSTWFDTTPGTGPIMYVWDGDSWEPIDYANSADVAADIATLQGQVNTALSDASDAFDLATQTALDLDNAFPITTTDITDDAITTPKLAANAITAKHTLTGPLIQTEATAARGIKMNSSALIAYNSSGTPTLNIDTATGAITMLGALTSGSTITGATVTGSIVQTSASANTGIKLDTGGLTAYNAGGFATISINAATGTLVTSGAILGGGEINGALLTGTGIQTNSLASRGIKINDAGLVAYDASGTPTLAIDSNDGSIALLGSITSGSTVTGAAITGGSVTGAVLATAASGQRIMVDTAAGYGSIRFYSAASGESSPGEVNTQTSGGLPVMKMFSPLTSTHVERAQIQLTSSIANESEISFSGSLFAVGLTVDPFAEVEIHATECSTDGNLRSLGEFFIPNAVPAGSAANAFISVTNRLAKITSSIRYKEDVRDYGLDEAMRAMDLEMKSYTWKSTGERFIGTIAEDAHELDLGYGFVQYDEQGRPDGFGYPLLGVAHHVIIKDLLRRIAVLEARLD